MSLFIPYNRYDLWFKYLNFYPPPSVKTVEFETIFTHLYSIQITLTHSDFVYNSSLQ